MTNKEDVTSNFDIDKMLTDLRNAMEIDMTKITQKVDKYQCFLLKSDETIT